MKHAHSIQRPRGKRGGPAVISAAEGVALKRLIEKSKAELKWVDNTVTGSAPTWAGLVTTATTIAQGVTANTRIGDAVRLQSIDVSWQIVNNAASTTMTRFLLFVDLDSSLGTVSDVLENIGTVLSPLSPIKASAMPTMRILYDEVIPTDAVYQGQSIARLHRKLNLLQTYKATTSTPVEHVIRLIVLPDTLAAPPSVDIYMRQWFTDE